MTIEDRRLDYLREQLDVHGLIFERNTDGHSDSYQFSISYDPEIELRFDRDLLATSSWLFTQRTDEAVRASSDARLNNQRGTVTMRFLDVAWQPRFNSL